MLQQTRTLICALKEGWERTALKNWKYTAHEEEEI
jgi:hypothetical protein